MLIWMRDYKVPRSFRLEYKMHYKNTADENQALQNYKAITKTQQMDTKQRIYCTYSFSNPAI